MNRIENLKSLFEIQSDKASQLISKYEGKKKGEIYNAQRSSIVSASVHLSKQMKEFGNGSIRKVSIYSKPEGIEPVGVYHTIWLDSSITEEEIKSYYALHNYKVLEVNFKEDLILGFPRIERK